MWFQVQPVTYDRGEPAVSYKWTGWCPNHTKLSVRFCPWNCWGLCSEIDDGPTTFLTITAGDADGRRRNFPVWSAHERMNYLEVQPRSPLKCVWRVMSGCSLDRWIHLWNHYRAPTLWGIVEGVLCSPKCVHVSCSHSLRPLVSHMETIFWYRIRWNGDSSTVFLWFGSLPAY